MRRIKRSLSSIFAASVILLSFCTIVWSQDESFELSGGGLTSLWDRQSGRMLELKYQDPELDHRKTFTFYDRSLGSGGFEVFDELDRVRYSDRHTPSQVIDFRVTMVGNIRKVKFTKQFDGAPFEMRVDLTSDASGLHLETETVLKKLDNGRWPRQRNIRISFVIPAKEGLLGWAPSYPVPTSIREKPVRYCYGIQELDLPRTGIPLYTLYAPGKAGISIVVPLDMPKVQLNLGPEPEDPAPLYPLYEDIRFTHTNPAEASLEYLSQLPPVDPEQVKVIRLTEFFVGLTADRPLRYGVWLYGHAPHWRPALGGLVKAYPEYFRMNSRMRSIYSTNIVTTVKVDPQTMPSFKRWGVASTWLHTHFHRHGEFIPPQAVTDPDFTFFCEPYAGSYSDNTARKNRVVIDALSESGLGVFLYGFNMHCDTVTVVQRKLFADVARTEDGSVTKSYHDQPVMFFNPASPYGSHLLRQMDLMIQLYPRIMGVGLDNWAYGGIDFAHDDEITMFGHRPAANINFSQQAMIGDIAEKWHRSGRLLMLNKARTIESMKGADSMLSEASGAEIFAMFAYLCLDRHLTPQDGRASGNPEYSEYALKYCLEWGAQMDWGLTTADPGMTEHYYKLIQGLRNRTWVFDPDPLTLPEGTRGNIFRIHRLSPWDPSDIVVTVIQPEVRISDRNFKKGMVVKVRLPEVDKITRASWLGVEDSHQSTITCNIVKRKDALVVHLPPVGSAGILRLEME